MKTNNPNLETLVLFFMMFSSLLIIENKNFTRNDEGSLNLSDDLPKKRELVIPKTTIQNLKLDIHWNISYLVDATPARRTQPGGPLPPGAQPEFDFMPAEGRGLPYIIGITY